MANKQDVKVNLLFEASAQSAINNLRQLGKELDNISSNTVIGVDDGALQRAVESAQQLQVHLQNAVDVDTGKIDLIKFNQSLKTAKTDLRTLSTDLQGMGTQGQQAFIKLAKAISIAETPVIKLNKKIADLGKTLLNTAKWQISSEVIHGVTGMLNEAVRHAEDLNAALSDIRIVTGASAQEMARFADSASVAARELNTTTTEYAKAALIFYQQGLSGNEVTKRTDTVIKLAQVTGQSAKMVSDQMTAIWNNFDDGTKSLEKYADVLTKLGAITAASTDEISEGLEKFAAVAETVGLEYETAAAAVATVVDKTRQSADVVGTSFKTIFARMQNLELGETLEDGVNLTKYSKALEDVGVKVLDAKGQMRDMDDILNDLGEKWSGLGKTTQTAIAQTVGGIRQYNQMMALMNNWGDVQKNIEAAKESGGELAKQAAIWSESYEAAQERLTQAKNELYESFVNDKFLIILQDLGSVLVDRFADFTESIGGAVPLVLMLVGLFSKILFPTIRNAFAELRKNLDVITGKAQKDIDAVQAEMRKMMQETLSDPTIEKGLKRQIELSHDLSKAREELAEKSKHMSAIEREEAEMRLHIAESLTSEVQSQLVQQSELEKKIRRIKTGLFSDLTGKEQREIKDKGKEHNARETVWQEERKQLSTTEEGKKKLETYTIEEEVNGKKISKIDWEKARKDFDVEFSEFLNREDRVIKLSADKKSLEETKAQLEAEKIKLEEEFAQLEMKNLGEGAMTDEEVSRYFELNDNILPTYSKQLDEISEKSKVLDEQILKATETESERTKQMLQLQEKYNEEKQKSIELTEAVIGTTTTENAFSQFNQAEASKSGAGKASKMMSETAIQQLGAIPSDINDNVNMNVSIESFSKALEVSNNYRTSLEKLTIISEEWAKNQQTLSKLTAKATSATKKLAKAKEEVEDAEKQVKSFDKSKKATLEYAKALERLRKAKNNQEKADKENQVAQKALQKNLESFKTTLISVAGNMGISEEQIKDFTTTIDTLSKSATFSEQEMKDVAIAISDMTKGAANASAGIDAIIDDMSQMLIQSGASEEAINALIEQFRKLGVLTPEIEQKLNLVKEQLGKLNKQPVSIGDKIEEAATSFATLAGQVTAAVGAIDTLGAAFSGTLSAQETFVSLLSGAAILLPIVSGATKALTEAKWIENASDTVHNTLAAAKIALAKAEGKEKSVLTAKTWGLAMAETALKIAQNPVLGAVILGLIGASVIAITAQTKATEAQTEATIKSSEAAKEEAESRLEVADAWLEQKHAMDEVIAQYKELTKESEEYEDTMQRILDSAPDLAQSFRDYAKAIGETTEKGQALMNFADSIDEAAAGKDVEGILKAKAEGELVMAESAKNDAQENMKKSFILLVNTLGRSEDTKVKDGNVVRHAGGVNTAGNEEHLSADILGKYFGNENKDLDQTADGTHGYIQGFDIKLRTDSMDNFIADYESLGKALTDMEDELGDNLSRSDTYREAKELYDAATEDYQTMIEAKEKYQQSVVEYNAANMAVQGYDNGGDITDIASYDDYKTYKENLMASATTEEDKNAVLEWLSKQDVVGLYQDVEKKLGYLKNNAKLDDSQFQDVEDYISSLNEEDLELFLEVNSNIFQTKEDITTEISRLKTEVAQEEIKLQIKTTSDVMGVLKEDGMSEDDWNSILESKIDWKYIEGSGIKDFNTFLNATYEEQKDYLEKLQDQQQENLKEQYKAEIDILSAQIQSGELTEEQMATYLKELEVTSNQLAILEKMEEIEAEQRRREAIEALGLEVEAVDELTKYLQENNDELANNSELAENMAKGLLLLANSLNITTEDLMLFTTALSGSFGGDGDGIHNALKDLNITAQETGTSLEELVNLSSSLASIYGLTGEAAVELTQYMAESSSKYDIPLQEMQVHAQVLRSTYKDASGAMKLTIVEATKLAVANQRMNKGLEQLSSGWVKWKKTLTAANKNTADYVATINEMTPAIRELIGAAEDFVLPEGFLDIEKNLELIESAAAGSTQAIQALGIAITKAQISSMTADGITAAFGLTKAQEGNPFETIDDWFSSVQSRVLNGITTIEDKIKNMDIGDAFTDIDADWIAALNEMALATSMSVEEMNALLGQMGLSADVTVTNVETQMQVPKYETTEIVKAVQDPNNDDITTYTKTSFTKQIGTQPVDATIPVATIGTEENPGTASIRYIGKDSPSTSSKSAGGSTSKPTSSGKKDIAKRYKNNDKLLEDKGRALSTAETALDELYGNNRIAKMEEINQLMAEENELLESRNEEIDDYLKKDKNALNNAMSGLGLSVSYNADGTIENEEELLSALQSKYDTAAGAYDKYAKDAFDDDGIIDATEQAELERLAEIRDTAGKDVDAAVDALTQYNDTLEERYTTEEKIAENNRKIMAQNYEMYIGKLNSIIEKNNNELEIYDYYLNKIADDNTQLAEATGYVSSKINVTTNSLSAYKNLFDDLTEAHAKKEIDDAKYVEGLNTVKEGIYAQLEALDSLDKEMLEYYSNTLVAASEEITKYTDKMSKLTSVLDHYQNLLSLMGKENDYESMGVVLQGMANTMKNAKNVAEEEYAMYSSQAAAKKALYESLDDTTTAYAEAVKKEWEAAETAVSEAQDRMLQSTADWAEAMKTLTENKLKGFASELEKALTGGISFDEMSTSMERASSLQEEYLTSTNKIYETTKMMRDMQKKMDETSNSVAKQKISAFMEQTEQLKSQGKLSKYELDIHKAEYDLLLAQIALEEAQSAKSTVRLQRDAEGNFGYVYTADSSKVSDAEQKVADAQNALYNKQLEGTNDYTQKYQQTLSEMYDTMSSLQEQYLSGEITTEEEYQRKMLEAQNYYYAKLTDYAQLYQVAISDNGAIANEAWSSEFAGMMTKTEEWKDSVANYLTECEGAFNEWEGVVSEISEATGLDLGTLATKVDDITKASQDLVAELTGENGVIKTLENELASVSRVTDAYKSQRDAIQDLTEEYEGYLSTINTKIAAANGWTINITSSPSGADITGMASGGYTGEWGPEGKLAVLHQKEIVLNAEDTENLLAAVETLHIILNTIDMQAMNSQLGGILSTPGFHGSENSTLEQNVKIEASFPGVQDRYEIEEAFNNLINKASQYANRY